MDANARNRWVALPRHRDLELAGPSANAPQLGSRLVADYRAVAGRQHGRHQLAVPGHVAAADRIDASVNPVEPPVGETMTDSIDREAEGHQLGVGDHPVLAPYQGPEPPSLRVLKG
jgi:hypothetical protein